MPAALQKFSEGYLFLCPSQEFKAGPFSLRWPDCPAYWSLDPSGVERLSREEATRPGFSPMTFDIIVDGRYWNANGSFGANGKNHTSIAARQAQLERKVTRKASQH
ncbi:hypothetical protein C8R44DRAFT_740669 [Mycena epipterygia]|nr:hypothetical protein C8R44DRAFT_740669 [Mycena epipterygia]